MPFYPLYITNKTKRQFILWVCRVTVKKQYYITYVYITKAMNKFKCAYVAMHSLVMSLCSCDFPETSLRIYSNSNNYKAPG